VLTALDSAKQLGISTQLDVYDTKSRLSEVSRILSNNDFRDYDAVIGPFTADNFDRTAAALKGDNVPVIAAVTTPKKLYSNVFQTIPSSTFLRKLIIDQVKSDSIPRHIIIITDSKNKRIGDALKTEFSSAKQILSRKDEDGNDANYILIDDIELEIKEGLNLVFLETSNEGFVSNVTSMLSALNGLDVELEIEREIILMTTDKNKSFENSNVSNYDLSSLKFQFPSVHRPYNSDTRNSFVRSYKDKYGAEPNKYAVRGFDLAMDVLLRLATENDLYMASETDFETEYVENKFRYSKKLFGGYYNETGYILKYEDLKIVEVKQ
jgi:hypothetical protein